MRRIVDGSSMVVPGFERFEGAGSRLRSAPRDGNRENGVSGPRKATRPHLKDDSGRVDRSGFGVKPEALGAPLLPESSAGTRDLAPHGVRRRSCRHDVVRHPSSPIDDHPVTIL
jgi:hypothetical protein